MQAQLSIPTFGDERLPPRFWAKVRIASVPAHRPDLGPCWEWTACRDRCGYGRFSIGSRRDGNRRLVQAHRFVYETLIGPIPGGLESDHLCRNYPCVNAAHLEPVTHTLNVQRGIHVMPLVRGEAHGSAKLREADIPVIRALRGRVTQCELGAWFGVRDTQISRIQRGTRWRHLLVAQGRLP